MNANESNRNFRIRNLVLLALVSVLILLNSPLFPFSSGLSDADSSAFRYIGKQMLKGQLPYRDIFAHSGPLIYLLNALGYLLQHQWGIWIIEVIFMTVFLYASLKTTRLFSEYNSIRLVSLFFTILQLIRFFDGGNLPEEYALPFLAVAQYYFLEFLICHKSSFGRMILSGICISQVLMLKLDMAVSLLVYLLTIMVTLLLLRKFLRCLLYVSTLLLGLTIGLAPYLIWLAKIGLWNDFISCYIDFNLKYIRSGYENILLLILYFFVFLSYLIIPLVIICGMYLRNQLKEHAGIYQIAIPTAVFLNLIFSMILILLAKSHCKHYCLLLVGPLLPSICLSFQYATLGLKNRRHPLQILILYSLFICLPLTMTALNEVTDNIHTALVSSRSENSSVVRYITAQTESSDQILVLGNEAKIYLDSQRKCGNYYIYQTTVFHADSSAKDRFYEELIADPPEMLILPKDRKDFYKSLPKKIRSYISKHYVSTYSDNDYMAYRLL